MKNLLKTIIAAVLGALVIAFVLVVGFPLNALWAVVFKDLWLWFVVPLGVPAIGFWQSIGLRYLVFTLLYGLATKSYDDDGDDNPMPSIVRAVLTAIVSALIFWGTGAIVHHFMIT